MDPEQAALEDLIRQRRIDEIYALKQSIQQLEEDIARGIATNKLAGDSRTAYLLLVKSYVRSLETILAPDDESASKHWTTTVIGRYELPNGTIRHVVGLQEFLELELKETVSWTETESPHRNALAQEQEKSKTVRPPRRIAETAFRAANIALRDKGVEIDTEDNTVDHDDAAQAPGIGG